MNIYSISDLHLSFNNPEKSMEKFGWKNYVKRIEENWKKQVKKEDIVLLPGDLSWALKITESYKDLDFIGNLPGKKFILKGNHDYWWTSLKKINDYFKENKYDITPVQYKAFKVKNFIISGVRGWEYNNQNEEDNMKKYNKELLRFDMTVNEIKNLYQKGDTVIFMMHYPPFTAEFPVTPFSEKIFKHKNLINHVVFGHLHSIKKTKFYNQTIENIKFNLVSADITDFKLVKII